MAGGGNEISWFVPQGIVLQKRIGENKEFGHYLEVKYQKQKKFSLYNQMI